MRSNLQPLRLALALFAAAAYALPAGAETSPYRVVAYYLMGKAAVEKYPINDNCVSGVHVPLCIEDIPAEQLTHLNWSFLGIDTNYQVELIARYSSEDTGNQGVPVEYIDEDLAIPVFELLNNVTITKVCGLNSECTYTTTPADHSGSPKHRNPDLKTLYAIGGWNFSRTALWQDVVRDPARREIFAASAVERMRRYGFDGIDIDWEYPNYPDDSGESADDGANFAATLSLIRDKLDELETTDGRDYLLSIASAGAPYAFKGYIAHMAEIAAPLDFVTVMDYDYSGPWDTGQRSVGRAQFHANLYRDADRQPYWFNFLAGMRDAYFDAKIDTTWHVTHLRDAVPDWRIPLDDNGSGYGGLYFRDFSEANIAANATIVIPETGAIRTIGDLARRWDGVAGNETSGAELKVTAKKYNLFAEGAAATGYERNYWLTNAYMFDLYRIAGVPATKLVMGVPFYGRVFRLSGPGTATEQFPVDSRYPGLYYETECDDGGRCTFYKDYGYMSDIGCTSHTCREDQRVIAYRDVAGMLAKGWHPWVHESTRAPGLYYQDDQVFGGWRRELFATYDDPDSLREKAAFIRSHGMGGAAFWELSQDDDQHSLLSALANELATSPPVVPYTIEATADAGGGIAPNGDITVNGGSEQTFTVTAGEGYTISDVVVDNVSVGAVASYTFSNVQADHTIHASFQEDDGGGGGGGGGGSGSACDGVSDWQPNTMYKQGDEVVWENSLYRAWRLVKRRENPPDDNSNWELVVESCQ